MDEQKRKHIRRAVSGLVGALGLPGALTAVGASTSTVEHLEAALAGLVVGLAAHWWGERTEQQHPKDDSGS